MGRFDNWFNSQSFRDEFLKDGGRDKVDDWPCGVDDLELVDGVYQVVEKKKKIGFKIEFNPFLDNDQAKRDHIFDILRSGLFVSETEIHDALKKMINPST